MKQWIIDRYNEGQNKYGIQEFVIQRLNDANVCIVRVLMCSNGGSGSDNLDFRIDLYDFLFNPKWGFSKAFWGEGLGILDKNLFIHQKSTQGLSKKTIKTFIRPHWYFRIKQMVVLDDPLKYLESFK